VKTSDLNNKDKKTDLKVENIIEDEKKILKRKAEEFTNDSEAMRNEENETSTKTIPYYAHLHHPRFLSNSLILFHNPNSGYPNNHSLWVYNDKTNTLYNLSVHVIPEELRSDVKSMRDDNNEHVYSFTLIDKYNNIDQKDKITLKNYSKQDRILPKETDIHLRSGYGIEFIALGGGNRILLHHDVGLGTYAFDESSKTSQLLKSTKLHAINRYDISHDIITHLGCQLAHYFKMSENPGNPHIDQGKKGNIEL
jgi:hypothetical protein